jgi:hypothetical protein
LLAALQGGIKDRKKWFEAKQGEEVKQGRMIRSEGMVEGVGRRKKREKRNQNSLGPSLLPCMY